MKNIFAKLNIINNLTRIILRYLTLVKLSFLMEI